MSAQSSALNELRRKYPWPQTVPDCRPVDWRQEAGGKHLVIEQIHRHQVKIVLEIGVCLGGSALQWLNASPDVHVLAVDHWKGGERIGKSAEACGQPAWVCEQLTRDENGFFQTLQKNLWPYRERVTLVRGMSLEVLESIQQCGVQPDLVYLDGDKSGREIEVCHRLFPGAILTGDDWFWGIDRFWNPDKGYPIRKPVRDFCMKEKRYLLTDKATWVISKEAPSWKYRLLVHPRYQAKGVRRRIRGAFRRLLKLDKAA